MFSCKYCDIFKNIFFYRTLWWLLRDLFLACVSSRLEVFYRKGVLRNFAKFTRKHKKEKKETPAQVFFCEFCKHLRTPFLTEYLQWLFLCMSYPILYPFFHILSRPLTGYLPLHFLIENMENEYSKLTSV